MANKHFNEFNETTSLNNTDTVLVYHNGSVMKATISTLKGKITEDIGGGGGGDTPKQLVYISATYIGESKYVGDTVSKSEIKVEAFFSDNSRNIVTSWTSNDIDTPLVSGTNTINISYGGLSTTVNITTDVEGRLTASQIVNNITVGWNLGGSFECSGSNVKDEAKYHTADEATAYETWWKNPVTTQAMIKAVKAKGFNAIRVPVTWCHHFIFDSNGNLSIAPVFLNRVKQVVKWILDEDMYCMINTHHDDANYGEGQKDADALGIPWDMTYPLQWLHSDDSATNSEVKETQAEMVRRFKTVWTVLANEFKNFGEKLIFESFNEIQGWRRNWSDPTEAQVNNTNVLAQSFVDAVRATGGNNATRTLCVQTYGSYETARMGNFKMPKDSISDAIIVQVHLYTNYFGNQAKALFESAIKPKFTDNNIPVVIGEFGVSTHGGIETEQSASRILKNVVAIAKSYGCKVFYWDSNDFDENKTTYWGLLNRKTLTWDRPLITQALFDGLTADPNDDGMVIKVKISSMNDCTYASICNNPYLSTYTSDGVKELGRLYPTTSGHFSPAKFFSVKPGDTIQMGSTNSGWRIDKYAFYDANWNVIDIVGCPSTPITVITDVPNNPAIRYVGFTVFNPWGSYTKNQIAQYMINSGLSIIFNSSSESVQSTPNFRTQVNATALTLSQTSLAMDGNKTVKLNTTITPSNSTNSIIWSSSSPFVATVDKNGNVTSTGNGSCIITCKVGNQTATCNVTVTGLATRSIDITTMDGMNYYGLNADGTQSTNISASQQAITTKPIILTDVPTGTKLNVSLRINGSAGWARILRWVFYDANNNFISSDFFKTASGGVNATPDSGTKGIPVPANAKKFRLVVFNPWAGELFSEIWYANQFSAGLVVHIDTPTGSLTIES